MAETDMTRVHTGAAVKGQFHPLPSVDEIALSEKSREELLRLLEQLLQRQPDIEPLVEVLLELPLGSTLREQKRPDRGRVGSTADKL